MLRATSPSFTRRSWERPGTHVIRPLCLSATSDKAVPAIVGSKLPLRDPKIHLKFRSHQRHTTTASQGEQSEVLCTVYPNTARSPGAPGTYLWCWMARFKIFIRIRNFHPDDSKFSSRLTKHAQTKRPRSFDRGPLVKE